MIFLTRLKVLLKRKSTLFWVLIFPLLLASAEYFAFGKFINSTPIETISIGIVEESNTSYLIDVFKEPMLDDEKKLYEVKSFENRELAQKELEEDTIELYVYSDSEELKIEAKKNGTAITITSSIIKQAKIIEKTIEDAIKQAIENHQNPYEVVNVEEITANMTKDID
ncbi:MAG: ABC transporter permease, partial [Anaeroplasmataceae bacterium]|nr:ABC transporter permease [Anaeroplasmataceae bacterium]